MNVKSKKFKNACKRYEIWWNNQKMPMEMIDIDANILTKVEWG